MGHAILIIDDDAAFRELLQGVFEQAGHKVLVARIRICPFAAGGGGAGGH
jgi:CheY-like chemotaxis protein